MEQRISTYINNAYQWNNGSSQKKGEIGGCSPQKFTVTVRAPKNWQYKVCDIHTYKQRLASATYGCSLLVDIHEHLRKTPFKTAAFAKRESKHQNNRSYNNNNNNYQVQQPKRQRRTR